MSSRKSASSKKVKLLDQPDHELRQLAHPARHEWDKHFREMADCDDDHLLDETTPTSWENTEWHW